MLLYRGQCLSPLHHNKVVGQGEGWKTQDRPDHTIVLPLELDKEVEERWIYFNYYPNSIINNINDLLCYSQMPLKTRVFNLDFSNNLHNISQI